MRCSSLNKKYSSMRKVSKTEWFLFHNSMVCLAKALEGKYTIVDLRNEACVSGKITEVDGFMNIEMEDCIFYDPRGSAHPFQSFFVKARNVRYVHIPKETPAIKLIEDQLSYLAAPPVKEKTRTYREKRSRQYHKEIVKELQLNK